MKDNRKKTGEALEWEHVRTDTIVNDEWINFRKSDYRLPDGSEIGPFYTYSRKDYAVIVASDTEGRYICVNQFRQGIREVTTEFPAGGIEHEDAIGETWKRAYRLGSADMDDEAFAAAKRELLEETGYESDEWEHLLTIPSNATISDNYAFLYRAKNCRKVAGQSLDSTEFLNVETYTGSEINEMIMDGTFQQAMHVTAWLMAVTRGN